MKERSSFSSGAVTGWYSATWTFSPAATQSSQWSPQGRRTCSLQPRIPQNIAEAVEIGLRGKARTLDVGTLNGERFAVMAGAGLDARMIQGADGT